MVCPEFAERFLGNAGVRNEPLPGVGSPESQLRWPKITSQADAGGGVCCALQNLCAPTVNLTLSPACERANLHSTLRHSDSVCQGETYLQKVRLTHQSCKRFLSVKKKCKSCWALVRHLSMLVPPLHPEHAQPRVLVLSSDDSDNSGQVGMSFSGTSKH